MENPKKIQELQLLEQNLQNLLMQKQNFQARLMENENALNELKDNKGQSYKIVGSIMIAEDNKKLEEDLIEEKNILDLRIKSIEKQEGGLKEKATKLQEEIMKSMG
ncbi:MAG: prefoldin subunit [Nanoarchaeota archaeon]|nr:prefoldin subunit [Nanoarchaeota archaeon]